MKQIKEQIARHYLLTIIAIIAITILMDYLSCKILFKEPEVVVLSWTALVMLWTAWETLGLKKLQRETLELEHRPYLQLQISARKDEIFTITNVGRGVATAIHIENFMVNQDDPQSSIGFKGIEALGSGESATLVLKGDGTIDNIKQRLQDSIRNETLDKILISYYDLDYWIYEARFRPRDDYASSFAILGSQKRTRKLIEHEK